MSSFAAFGGVGRADARKKEEGEKKRGEMLEEQKPRRDVKRPNGKED